MSYTDKTCDCADLALYLERLPEIEAMKKQIRESVAAQVEAEFPGNVTSPAMRENDIESYLNW